MNHYHRIANAGEVGARPKKEMGHAEAQPQEKTTWRNSTPGAWFAAAFLLWILGEVAK